MDHIVLDMDSVVECSPNPSSLEKSAFSLRYLYVKAV